MDSRDGSILSVVQEEPRTLQYKFCRLFLLIATGQLSGINNGKKATPICLKVAPKNGRRQANTVLVHPIGGNPQRPVREVKRTAVTQMNCTLSCPRSLCKYSPRSLLKRKSCEQLLECYLIDPNESGWASKLKMAFIPLLLKNRTLRALFTKFLIPGLTPELCYPLGDWSD